MMDANEKIIGYGDKFTAGSVVRIELVLPPSKKLLKESRDNKVRFFINEMQQECFFFNVPDKVKVAVCKVFFVRFYSLFFLFQVRFNNEADSVKLLSILKLRHRNSKKLRWEREYDWGIEEIKPKVVELKRRIKKKKIIKKKKKKKKMSKKNYLNEGEEAKEILKDDGFEGDKEGKIVVTINDVEKEYKKEDKESDVMERNVKKKKKKIKIKKKMKKVLEEKSMKKNEEAKDILKEDNIKK